MKYILAFEKNVEKQLRKIDTTQKRFIMAWIHKNLSNDLGAFGAPLKGNLKNYWRYRVGNYRIIAEIIDEEVKVIIIKIEHRKNIYD